MHDSVNLGWQKNKVSSTNCSSLVSTHLWLTLTPSKTLFLEASLTKPAKPLVAIRNKKGVSG